MPNVKPATLSPGERFRIVASKNVVADVVALLGGNAIELISPIPVGADPHTFVPAAQDVVALSDAHENSSMALGWRNP